MIFYLKKLIPFKLKKVLISALKKEDIILDKKKRAFIFLYADYGNIGDIAISVSQKNFLLKHLSDYDVFPIPISKTLRWIDSIQEQIKSDDVVTIIGGGNMGSLYPEIEELRQLIISYFPNNRIVCFPQTLDWDNTSISEKAIKKIVNTYSKHHEITIFSRESITDVKLKQVFGDKKNIKIGLVPDIVLSSTAKDLGGEEQLQISGILKCLRMDKESILTSENHEILDKILSETGLTVCNTDTHVGGSIFNSKQCDKLLAEKINEFSSARLIITDRLHGMILCLLSGTPCLVLPNSNHKIKQTYLDWLKDHSNLIFVESENFHQISNFINHLLSQPRGKKNDNIVDLIEYTTLIEALSGK